MQRVLVMGSSGSGKSTFARRLSEITDIPFVSLDQRPKLLDYFGGMRADQSLVCFTDRMQANDYLREIARKRARASIH